ncbi:MAG: hypothetical protein IKT79_11240 [Akkermansia sp.]|nr:hypothetical protein [Akkermansia sp.]
MDTQCTPTENTVCCNHDKCCARRQCCKMALGLINTVLMATLTTAVTIMCIHKCSHRH